MPLAIPAPIPTARLVIRRIDEADLGPLMAVNGDETVTRFLPYAAWKSLDDARSWLARMRTLEDAGAAIQFVIAEKAGGLAIGTALVFRHEAGSARAELGYVLGRAHWGRGLMLEALEGLIDAAFGPMNLRRLEAEVDPRNAASCRVLERLGFAREGLLRERWGNGESVHDVLSYGLLAREWHGRAAPADPHAVDTPAKLEAIYGEPAANSIRKETDHIPPVYRAMIEASPFVVLATAHAKGLDVSPRGDPAGFVAVADEKTLLVPERRGNNRADSLRNLLADSRVALLFLIPGVGETLRVSGRARFTTDPALTERFAMDGRPPKGVLVVTVEKAYFQCARAILRSRLWEDAAKGPAMPVPSAGTILASLTDQAVDANRYDSELPERQRQSLY